MSAHRSLPFSATSTAQAAVAHAQSQQRAIAALALRAAITSSLMLAAMATTACSDNSTSPKPRIEYGASQALGNGSARTFVAVDASGKPTSVGVALSEAALTNLPMTPNAPSPSAAMLTLALPTTAPATSFDHIMLDWNPQGHEPDNVYTHPHFDFHFYKVSAAEVMAIMPTDPQFATKAAALPAAQYVPSRYQAAHILGNVPAAAATVPMMGLHWLDTASPELQPPPAGRTFTETFIYGSYNGKFIFLEPMITKAYLESLKNNTAMTRAIPTPAKVQEAGYYPSAYSIGYDAAAKEYRITLQELTYRQAQ